MRSMRGVLCVMLLVLLLAFLVTGCDDDESSMLPTPGEQSNCVGCHTSEQMLKATALPDPPPSEDEGEG